jgi:uncharacterized damage-inducible protein DinB
MTPQGAVLMAEYNRWMNERIFEAAETLEPAELLADRGAFFGSILGTLNHIASGDTVWLQRFARHPAAFVSLVELSGFQQPSSLRHMMAPDLPTLRVYRRRLDEIIVRWTAELTPEHLATTLTYTNMAGIESSKSFAALVQHVFNHQTHHRGQITTLLFQAGVDVGVTDLLAVLPERDA